MSIDELEFINAITNVVISASDINQMCEAIARELQKRMPVEWAGIVIIKKENLYFQSLSSKIETVSETGDLVPLKGTVIEYVANTKNIFHEPDISQQRRFRLDGYHLKQGIRSIVYAPLIAEDRVFGALVIASTQPNAYRDMERLLFHATSQMAIPIKNAILIDRIERRKRLLESVSVLTKIILSDVILDNVYQAFSKELRRLVAFDRLSIAMIEGDNIRYFAVSEETGTERISGSIYPLKDSNTGWVAKYKRTLIQDDLAKKRMFSIDDIKFKEGIRSSIHVPLFYKGEVFGTINLSSLQPKTYGEQEKEILEHLAGQIAGAIMNAHLYRKIKEDSRYDALTGVFNRRYFNERVDEEIKRRSRHGGVFSLALCDLDFFKHYNDRYGHVAGDRLLSAIGGVLKSSIRLNDLVFRYGGDEFIILFPDTDSDGAISVVERVRKNIEEEMKKRKIPLTCSFGLATWPKDGIRESEIMEAADTAAFLAKERGGNQCQSYKILKIPHTGFEVNDNNTIVNIIYSLISAIEARDIYTHGHSREVNKYSLILSEAIGLSKEEKINLSRAALLHDIGNLEISKVVLNKKGKLTEEEWKQVKEHPQKGVDLIGHISGLYHCKPAILHHHERWDGKGYPSGLKGKEIPLEARILAIADAFSAMVSARPYRPAMSYEKAILELKKEAGKQFDPELVDVFVTEIEKLLPTPSYH
jgi:diguanylate cyclase (GGDEF)-like protein